MHITKSFRYFGAACCGLFALGVTAMAESAANSAADPLESDMKQVFNATETLAPWRAINDGVMGGRSSGGPSFLEDHMVFSGIINTNGGGFSSIRSEVPEGTLEGASGIKLRVRSDGRVYKLTFRTDVTHRWRRVSFQAEIPQTTLGVWENVTVKFEDLTPSIFGRPLQDKLFNPKDVIEMGIIIADGKDGPFHLDIAELESVSPS